MTTDLKTFILELAEKKPNMRAYSMAREIRKWEKNWALQQENYNRQLARQQHLFNQQNYPAMPWERNYHPPVQMVVSKPSLWQRFKTWFNAEVEGYDG